VFGKGLLNEIRELKIHRKAPRLKPKTIHFTTGTGAPYRFRREVPARALTT
jgi:hypothetical protein